MTSSAAAKSILKQPKKAPDATDQKKTQAELDRQNLSIAFHHAHRIQNQKDAEAVILSNIETLLDFPPPDESEAEPTTPQPSAAQAASTTSNASTSPTTPHEFSLTTRAHLLALLTPFQPSDLTNLVEERVIDSKCGYPLCPARAPPRSLTLGTKSAWRFHGRENARNFCSDECWKRALFVRGQLCEVPVWERDEGVAVNVKLLEDEGEGGWGGEAGGEAQGGKAGAAGFGGPVITREELAAERGEVAGETLRAKQVMTNRIVEKKIDRSNVPSAPQGEYGEIEGYRPTEKFRQRVLWRDGSGGGDSSDEEGGDDDGNER